MANEPERPIEKLLRDAAKKRGGEAGGFDLHPATRRILQGEVARKFAKEIPKPATRPGNWLRFWPRAAWAMAILIALIAVVWMVIPKSQENHLGYLAKKESTDDLVLSPPQPAPTPVPAAVTPAEPLQRARALKSEVTAPSATPASASRSEMADNEKKSSAGTVASISKYADRSEAVPAGASAKDQNAPANVASTGYGAAPARALSKEIPASDGSVKPTEVNTAALKSVPAAADALSFGGATRSANAVDSRLGMFKTTNSAPVVFYAFNQQHARDKVQTEGISAKNKSSSNVLASFQVQQQGNTLRIIDQDGSIYSGSMQPTASANRKPTTDMPSLSEASSSLSTPPAWNVVYTFRVTGTNSTLHKKIVFKGSLTTTNHPIATAITGTLNDLGGSGGEVRQPLANSHIIGKLSVGGGKEVDIKAGPAHP